VYVYFTTIFCTFKENNKTKDPRKKDKKERNEYRWG